MIDDGEVEIVLGAEASVDRSMAEAEVAVQQAQRCTFVAVASEHLESGIENGPVVEELWAPTPDRDAVGHRLNNSPSGNKLTDDKKIHQDCIRCRVKGDVMRDMGRTRAIDLFTNSRRWGDVDLWEQAVLELHDIGPMHRVEVPGYAPFWAVIDHATVLEVERRSNDFHNAMRPVLASVAQEEARRTELKALIHMDGDEHAAYRRLAADWFKPASIGRMDERLSELSRNCVRTLERLGGQCDVVAEIALPYPLQVILEMLGLPEGDYGRMLRLTQELFGQEDPDLQREPASPSTREAIIADFYSYFESLTESRRRHPTNDLASVIANGLVDGELLPHQELMGYYIILSTAGHDTTSNAIAGGFALLARHPEALEMVRGDESLLGNAVEEILRLTAPVRHFMRTVVRDTEIAGREVRTGERLLLSYKAANLDPKVFADPRTFDIRRHNAAKNVSFGFGAHFCLGSQLARNEMRSLFSHVIARLRSLHIEGEPKLTESVFVGGYKYLPVRYELIPERV